jgi:hypothetical protein
MNTKNLKNIKNNQFEVVFLSKLGIRFIFRTDIPDNIDRFAPSGHCLGEARQLVLFQTEFSSLGVEAHDSLHPSAAATTARPWQRPPACFSQQCRHGWGKSNEVFGERNVIRLPRSMMARGTSCALISWLKSESLGNSWNCRSSTDWVHNVKMKMKFRNGASHVKIEMLSCLYLVHCYVVPLVQTWQIHEFGTDI